MKWTAKKIKSYWRYLLKKKRVARIVIILSIIWVTDTTFSLFYKNFVGMIISTLLAIILTALYVRCWKEFDLEYWE